MLFRSVSQSRYIKKEREEIHTYVCKEKKPSADSEIFSDEKDSGNNAQLIPEEKEKEIATNVMLDRLEATGMKHLAFDGLGTFKKTTSVKLSLPTAENGGKETAVKWLEMCLESGVITPAQLLDLQQARLVTEPVLAIEQAVAEYNQQQILNGSTDLLPPSPFNRFEQTTLSTPRTRKA